MNGSRQREDSDDEGQLQKRPVTKPPSSSDVLHYDIYAIPSLTPPSPLLHSPHQFYQSASFVVVNRAAGLHSGLGARFGLSSSIEQPHTLVSIADPGFFLPREPSYDPSKAVLLGWVEEEQLSRFEQIVRSVDVPTIATPPHGNEMLQWLLGVAQRLEYEGICANGELLLEDVLQRREGLI